MTSLPPTDSKPGASGVAARRVNGLGNAGTVVRYPKAGVIEIKSKDLFGDTGSEACRRFLERVFLAQEVNVVEVQSARGMATINYAFDGSPAQAVIKKVANYISSGGPDEHHDGESAQAFEGLQVLEHYAQKQMRFQRYGPVVSTWAVKHETPGRIRFKNPIIYRKGEICQNIERELMSVLGVDNYNTDSLTSTVLIQYDPRKIQRHQLVEILDSALIHGDKQHERDAADLDFPLATTSLAIATVAQFAFPPLIIPSAMLFAYTLVPSVKQAIEVLRARRLGVDVLDTIVGGVCLITGQVFAGAVLAWCLSFGRKLLKKTEDDSKKMLLNVFGKQPRFVWLLRDGVEVEVALEKIKTGDTIVVHTGETVPVDGKVIEGMAMIDQHTLTGESSPAEKVVGDNVFASTVMLAGKIHVEVTKAGTETTSAKISQILNDTAGYKMDSQTRGEEMADKAVIPTLAIATLGLSTIGVNGATAIVNCDFGTGIRMAAPLGMLSSLTLCAQHGILVKDGRALESMDKVDTFLFDKTGTLTRERPEVGRIIVAGSFSADTILAYAAAAEQKFSHPIAKAILDKFEQAKLTMPKTNESKYAVGYGITVEIEGHTVRVGSARFVKMEGIEIPDVIKTAQDEVHATGSSLIMVAIDNELSGALELVASPRPEAIEIVRGLRARGVKHIAIISGDHTKPTEKLAKELGMDRFFAEVLPQDKANYVELLQKEGKTVCFVGDGINDSIALKKANVSISLRGASSVATDTAQVVFMEESLKKILELKDISRDLTNNINRSWMLIAVPNIFCIAGAFFFGFGVMHSVVFNNVSAIGALVNGLSPLKKAAELQAEKDMHLEAAFGPEHALEGAEPGAPESKEAHQALAA
ncbi:heavy metal translocating P-type ATPase [Verrucomicrobia bacterium LW23]|nr:heavy metal translocating P-type ATPase [Verrucomicrobia bacterium LW23]